MPKRVVGDERKTPMIALVSVKIREQLDALADRQRVSISEITRRALSEYVEKQKP